MRLLHSTNDGVLRRTLRRLHVRFWHAGTSKMIEILRLAGAPNNALKIIKEIVDTCRVCRMWSKPAPKSMTTSRMARDFNEIVQWDILFHRKQMISHLLDEAIRWRVAALLMSKNAQALIEAIMTSWVRPHGPMKLLIADGERGLATEEVAQFLDRVFIQLKTKAPGEHAQMVERHHELLRRLLLKVESQLVQEGIVVPFSVILSECVLAKNVLTSVAGQTPYKGLYGREPPGLAEFEPVSETQLDDTSGGVAGYSRYHHRVREVAVAAMVQETAQLRIERALQSKTRLSIEQLELEPGQLVDFWRKPATKDESGWRGPATVLSIGDPGSGSPLATIQWQGSKISVRTQDLRRALVYFAMLMFPATEHEDPREVLFRFLDGMKKGQLVRVGWVRCHHGGESSPTRWLRAKASAQHSEVLLAVLHVAATHFGLAGCVGARLGHGVAKLESIVDCDRTLVWWWRSGRPKLNWSFETVGPGPVRLTDLFGADAWSECQFVQFVMASEDEVNAIRLREPGIPNVGGLDGPDRPPPDSTVQDVPDSPMPSRPSTASRSRSEESMRRPDSGGEQSPTRSQGDLDDLLAGSDSESTSRTASASSRRSRSARGGGRARPESPPPQRPKRSRPSSLASRGPVNRKKTGASKQLTPGLPEEYVEKHTRHDPEARSSSGPELPLAPEPWVPPESWGPWPNGPNDPHEGWDPGDDDEGPPGLNESDGEETVDYRDAESDEEDDQFDSALSYLDDSFTRALKDKCLEAYLQECGTQVEHAPVESLDVQNGAAGCWSSVEREIPDATLGGEPSPTSVQQGPLEVMLSRQMSLLMVPSDGEQLPPLSDGEHYVVQFYPSGAKKTVVEREHNILTREEALQHEAACNKAMLDEMQRWANLGAFERMPKKCASNVIDARWVLKWKVVQDQRIIKARLVVRGFKDLQAAQLSTYAGTTTRWGQRLVNSVAVQHQWPLFTADVSQAFLRGLTFEQAAQMKDEVQRDVQFTMPPGSTHLLKKLPGFTDFNPLTEVLRMLRCGFGLKDAPRLWNKVLRRVLKDLGLSPTQADPQLFVWHAPQEFQGGSGGESSLTHDSRNASKKRLVLILSTHVDDFKGAGEEPFVKRLLAGLEKEFSSLSTKRGTFECVGIMHELNPTTLGGHTNSIISRR